MSCVSFLNRRSVVSLFLVAALLLGCFYETAESQCTSKCKAIFLVGFRLGTADHKAFMRVNERDVGIVTWGDIALAEQAKPLRRVPTQKLSHVIV